MRFVVDAGERAAKFFAEDMQNIYYRYLFKQQMKQKLKHHEYPIDRTFEFKCKQYWHKYARIDSMWHTFYSYCNGIKDVRYIPENIYYSKIEPFYNRKAFAKAIDDKCFYTERFKNIKRPDTIIRNISGMYFDNDFNIISLHDAIGLCYEYSEFVVKLSIDGTGGNFIKFIRTSELSSPDDLVQVFLKYEKDFIVESIITQHNKLSSINSSSVNTIRFITFLNNNGVHLLSSVFRMGGIGSRTDNFSTGGICCGIDKNGILKSVAYDMKYNKYTHHPSGGDFANIQIPSYDMAINAVKNQHKRFGHFRIISWDIAIDAEGGIVLIEFNITPQGVGLHQINNGPLFGDLTDEVLEEVFRK